MNSICSDIKSGDTSVSVGKLLRQARQKHSVRDLNVISRELCISSYLLEALEEDDFSAFPSSCYAIGFLRNYSDFLKLDTNDFVARYEHEYAGSKECVVLSFPEVEYSDEFPIKRTAGIAMLSIAILFGVWSSFNKLDAEEVSVTNLPTGNLSSVEEINTSPQIETILNSQENELPPVSEPPIKIAALSPDVLLKANEDVWIRLATADGLVLVEKILEKGENFVAPKSSGLKLMTNNAAALVVYVNSKPLEALGGKGKIFEGIILD